MSNDGQKIIGHMVLRKSLGSGSSSSILGLKVVGGKLLEDGSMGALIEKVKQGSPADVEGQLRSGKMAPCFFSPTSFFQIYEKKWYYIVTDQIEGLCHCSALKNRKSIIGFLPSNILLIVVHVFVKFQATCV